MGGPWLLGRATGGAIRRSGNMEFGAWRCACEGSVRVSQLARFGVVNVGEDTILVNSPIAVYGSALP